MAYTLRIDNIDLSLSTSTLDGCQRLSVELRTQAEGKDWLLAESASGSAAPICQLPPTVAYISSSQAACFEAAILKEACILTVNGYNANGHLLLQASAPVSMNLQTAQPASKAAIHLSLTAIKQASSGEWLPAADSPSGEPAPQSSKSSASSISSPNLEVHCDMALENPQAKATQLQHKLAEIMCRLDRALPAAVLEEGQPDAERRNQIQSLLAELAPLQAGSTFSSREDQQQQLYHLERCTVAPADTLVWLEYGLFSARQGQHAHQAEALAWLEAVASTQESAKAEAIRQAILAPQPPMSGATPSAQSATWQVICLLVDELCLGSCASRLLERLPQLHASNASDSDANSPQPDVSPCSEADVALCRGQIAALHGSRKDALDFAQQAVSLSAAVHSKAAILSANVHYAAGNSTAALASFEEAAASCQSCVPLTVLLRVAGCHVRSGSLPQARTAMLKALEKMPLLDKFKRTIVCSKLAFYVCVEQT
ncbi:hypothetical protein WJX84_003940 [Apatococcus fuscideae]|uniref:Uncharacterized protein n=1 Tax=Apatococcus fuscideae TaxID=2026836 RepID=A0AAW1RG41_9CHLO